MALKKIKIMDISFRDGFQSVYGARVKTEDFLPAVEASSHAGIDHFEFGGGARFQSLFFYCNESAFDMMDKIKDAAGKNAKLQTLARGINVVGLAQQPKDIIQLHAKMFAAHGTTHIRNFDALNDMHNLDYSGRCIVDEGLHHQIAISLMGLPPGISDGGVHTADFYMEKLKDILNKGIPFDSLVFKDASGTCPPKIVYDSVKKARKILGEKRTIWFHSHSTAGLGEACLLSAIEASADGIDIAQSPVSGGTSHPDILSMWHALEGTEYTLGVDYKKLLESRKVFEECMEKYMTPPEAKMTSANIVLSPMPGGALTANTMMMRDTKTLHLFPKVIEKMGEVVAKGGFGTSVTPVSQFYFQQAYTNVVSGDWKKITDGYGKMVLGYFGKTPRKPNPKIVELASKQLGKEPFDGDPVDLLDAGIPAATKILKENNLPQTQENVFIIATCKEKGLDYLLGKSTTAVYYKTAEQEPTAKPSSQGAIPKKEKQQNLIVNVNGVDYNVSVREQGEAPQSFSPSIAKRVIPTPLSSKKSSAPPPPPSIGKKQTNAQNSISAPIAGQVLSISKKAEESVEEGDTVLILEAMKMENEIPAPKSGSIGKIFVGKGDFVKEGDPLFTIS